VYEVSIRLQRAKKGREIVDKIQLPREELKWRAIENAAVNLDVP